jgi:hypothetical protein
MRSKNQQDLDSIGSVWYDLEDVRDSWLEEQLAIALLGAIKDLKFVLIDEST